MQINQPSPFFRRYELEQGSPDLHSRLASRRRTRRLLAAVSLIAAVGLAFGVALYCSTPHQPLRWRSLLSHRTPPAMTATPVPGQQGAVGLSVTRGRKKHVFQFHQDGQSWAIEDLTAPAPKRPPVRPPPPPPELPAYQR